MTEGRQVLLLLSTPGAPGIRVTLRDCPPRVLVRGVEYVRVDDPDTGAFLGAYVRSVCARTAE